MTVLKVATCQFPVSADIEQNTGWITRQMHEAARQGARVAHFPEGALSGYAGTDFETFTGYDWDALDRATDRVREYAGELGIWVVTGSAHRFSGLSAPHNSLYVISDGGQVTERYDKRFLGGTDLDHYSPGSHFSTWAIDEIRCGALICYDYRFPEFYRSYVTLDVQLVFHSFHAANASPDRVAAIGAAIGTQYAPLNPAATLTYPGVTMPAVMTASAACNNVWKGGAMTQAARADRRDAPGRAVCGAAGPPRARAPVPASRSRSLAELGLRCQFRSPGRVERQPADLAAWSADLRANPGPQSEAMSA